MTDKTIREARQLAFDELYRFPQKTIRLAIDESFPEQFANEISQQEVFNSGRGVVVLRFALFLNNSCPTLNDAITTPPVA
jgi:hypothetical protein